MISEALSALPFDPIANKKKRKKENVAKPN